MGKTAMWRRYLRFWGADPPADVDAEIDFHLDALFQHFIARGMTADQARREASRRFGNVARVRSECLTADEGSMRRHDAAGVLVRIEGGSLALRLARDYPQANAGWDILVTGLLPLGPGEKVFFGLVTTLTSLLLAAACAHIANLLLARGMERRGEVAIRASLGARRGRIMRQLFVESVALSIAGGVCSLLIALPIVVEIRTVLGPRTPYLSDLSLDGAALALTAGLTLLATALFGLAPALRLSSVTASDAMKQPPGGAIASRRRRPLVSALIGLEVTIATVALIVTALRSGSRCSRVEHSIREIRVRPNRL